MENKKTKKIKSRGKIKETSRVSFSKTNYRLFGIGILVLLLGYLALAQGPVDGFLSLTLSPILLVIGYCVIIPIAILFSEKDKAPQKD